MKQNPYQSPTSPQTPPLVGGLSLRRPESSAVRSCPKGVFILAIWNFLSGPLALFGLISTLITISEYEAVDSESSPMPWPVLLLLLFPWMVAFASSFGLWRGARWGWWLAAGSCAYLAINNAAIWSYFTFIIDVDGESLSRFEREGHFRRFYLFFVNFLLCLYLFRTKVLRYFYLEKPPKLLLFAILLAIPLLLEAGFIAVAFWYMQGLSGAT